MQRGIEILGKLTMEEQESILKMISYSTSDLSPIEIDDRIYYIPSAVNELIENLYSQSYNFLKGDNGTPQNKE